MEAGSSGPASAERPLDGRAKRGVVDGGEAVEEGFDRREHGSQPLAIYETAVEHGLHIAKVLLVSPLQPSRTAVAPPVKYTWAGALASRPERA